MLYAEYMFKVKECTIYQDDATGQWCLDPDWKVTLFSQDLGNPKSVTAPYTLTFEEVEDVLKLEVEKRNKLGDYSKQVSSWLFDLITQQIEPTVMKEETDYIASMMDYLKFKAAHPEITKAEEENSVGDEKVKQLLRSGMNFSKKE